MICVTVLEDQTIPVAVGENAATVNVENEVIEHQGGATHWDELTGKPFERIGDTLAVHDGTLDVNIHETTNPSGGLTIIIG